MIEKSLILLIFFAFLTSCNNDVPVSIELKGSGIFKVDTLSYSIDEAIGPTDSLWNYVEYRVAFHFENYRGTLNYIEFILDDSVGRGMFIDYAYPDSINIIRSWSEKLWLSRKLNNEDSVKIGCKMEGAFWEEINNTFQSVDSFSWSNQQIIYYNNMGHKIYQFEADDL